MELKGAISLFNFTVGGKHFSFPDTDILLVSLSSYPEELNQDVFTQRGNVCCKHRTYCHNFSSEFLKKFWILRFIRWMWIRNIYLHFTPAKILIILQISGSACRNYNVLTFDRNSFKIIRMIWYFNVAKPIFLQCWWLSNLNCCFSLCAAIYFHLFWYLLYWHNCTFC